MIRRGIDWKRSASASAGAIWLMYALALVSSGSLFAQSSGAKPEADYPWRRWERFDPDNIRMQDEHTHLDKPLTIDRGALVSSVVTLPELSHYVPGQA